MGNTQKPPPPEPDPSPDRNPDFEDPRLTTPGPESPDFPQNQFPDHAPLPLHDEPADTDEDIDNSAAQRDFYRATSDPEVHQPYVPKQRVKVRRKNQKSVPEWERGEGADGAEDDASSPSDGSQKRRSRRKSKPQSKWAKILGATPKVFIYLTAFLVTGFLVAGLIQILGNNASSLTESPQTPAPSSDSGGIMNTFLTEKTRKSVEDTLNAYFAAENWKAKLPLLRGPERVRPLMEDWYNRPENLGADTPAKVSYPPEYQKQIPIGNR
ncbi:MAG: hypothetical protein P8J87_11280, partial [Verrucomicrobiales bacterium]|nr:hypothetical protein [Verrucomicrobiales bacterium]